MTKPPLHGICNTVVFNKDGTRDRRLRGAVKDPMITCQRCGGTKPRSEWPTEGHTEYCVKLNKVLKYCCSKNMRSAADVARDMETKTKQCSHCSIRKPFSDFSPNKTSKDGRQTTCRPCRSAKVHSGEWSGNVKRRALIKERSDGSLTNEVLNEMFSISVCPCCDGWMRSDAKALDHIIPIKLGGEHTIKNVMVLCWTCNSGKHAYHPSKWLRMLKPEAADRMRLHYSKIGLNFD